MNTSTPRRLIEPEERNHEPLRDFDGLLLFTAYLAGQKREAELPRLQDEVKGAETGVAKRGAGGCVKYGG